MSLEGVEGRFPVLREQCLLLHLSGIRSVVVVFDNSAYLIWVCREDRLGKCMEYDVRTPEGRVLGSWGDMTPSLRAAFLFLVNALQEAHYPARDPTVSGLVPYHPGCCGSPEREKRNTPE
ncbi:hypothetical protein K2X96_03395 [Patescibacteria group bacterium]|nr:hypothetical protein [Patescibacteria group bacterium]